MKKDGWKRAQEAFVIETKALAKARKYIDRAAFAKAVTTLAGAKLIAASGCGHSGIACQHFAHLMCCIERPARFISPADALHGGSGFLQKGDVMVLASRGGKTEELLPIIGICKSKGVNIISITEDTDSPIACGSDIVIRMHVERETDRHNSQGTTSFIVLSAVFDSLQAAIIEETGFRNEQFAVIHPGGAVGKRLNRRKVLPGR